jgi:hypothetical protein
MTGTAFCLQVKMGKPGKYFVSWLYEREGQNRSAVMDKTAGRELLHLYHPPAPRFGEFDPCIWDHRCRTDRGSLRRHSKSRARLPRNTRPHSRTRHAFAVRHRHARDDRLGMVARVRLWLDAQALRSFPPRFRPSPPHGCYSPRQPRGTLARTVPQPAVPAWAKVAVVFWVAFVPLAENVTLAGPVLDQV